MKWLLSFSTLWLAVTALASAIDPAGSIQPIVMCQVPLHTQNFDLAKLDACTDIVFSSVYNIFDDNSFDLSTAAGVSARKTLTAFVTRHNSSSRLAFSLQVARNPPPVNLQQLFYSAEVMDSLLNFMHSNKLESFDLSWAYLQSGSIDPLERLKSTLNSSGFRFTTTFSNDMTAPDSDRMRLVSQIVDRIYVAPGEQVSMEQPQPVFQNVEVNSGEFLNVYLALNLNRAKIIVGQSIRTMTWTFDKDSNITSIIKQFVDSGVFEEEAVLETESYYNSCQHFQHHVWIDADPAQDSFHRMAVNLSENQLIFPVDPQVLVRRMDRIVESGFAGIALYDYYSGYPDGKCSDVLALVGGLIRSSSRLPLSSISTGVCIPFLGLLSGCPADVEMTTTPEITDTTLLDSTEFLHPQTTDSSVEETTLVSTPFDQLESDINEEGSGSAEGSSFTAAAAPFSGRPYHPQSESAVSFTSQPPIRHSHNNQVNGMDASSAEVESEPLFLTTESFLMLVEDVAGQVDESRFHSLTAFTEEPVVTEAADEFMEEVTEAQYESTQTAAADSSEESEDSPELTEESIVASYVGFTEEGTVDFSFETTENPLEFTQNIDSASTEQSTDHHQLIVNPSFTSTEESTEELVIQFSSTEGSPADSSVPATKKTAHAFSTEAPVELTEEHAASERTELPQLPNAADVSSESPLLTLNSTETASGPTGTTTNAHCANQTEEVIIQVKINKADIQRLNELLDQLRLLNLCKMAGNSPFLSSLLCQQQPLDDSSNAGSYASPASKTAPPTTYPKMWTQSWAQSASLQFQQLQRKPQRLLSNEEIIKRLRGHHTKLRNVTPAGMLNN